MRLAALKKLLLVTFKSEVPESLFKLTPGVFNVHSELFVKADPDGPPTPPSLSRCKTISVTGCVKSILKVAVPLSSLGVSISVSGDSGESSQI